MFIFWIIASALIGGALLFVLPFLFKKAPSIEVTADQNAFNVSIYKEKLAELESENLNSEEFARAKIALDRNLLQEIQENPVINKPLQGRWAGFVVLLGLPLLAVSLYFWLGSPELLNPNREQVNANEMPANLEESVAKLAERLKENPNDLMGWQMLGRSYSVLGKYTEAADAYKNALSMGGDIVPDILADSAETLAALHEDQFEEQAIALLEKALKLEPAHQKTLWLLGIVATQKNNYELAIEYWQKLLAQFSVEDAESRELLQNHIAQAQQLAEASKTGALSHSKQDSIHVSVRLMPSLQSHIKPTDIVFIYAIAQETKQLLSAIKKPANELPFSVILDDSLATGSTAKLSDFQSVTVFARISHSDSPVPQSGDLQGQATVMIRNVGNTQPAAEMVINQVIP